MRSILSISISILSIIVGVGIVTYYYITGSWQGLEGAGWILAILGAPTTLLDFVVYKLGLAKGFIQDFLWICFFYFLQYQLIALLIYKPFQKMKILLFALIFTAVIVSGFIVYYIAIGRYEHMASKRYQATSATSMATE